MEEFKRNPSAMWIMKPTNMAQGKGIFIINKLSQLKKWSQNGLRANSSRASYIISRYVENPLLVGGKKFDLRLYVLVTSYRPLRCYQYLHGFARFCNVKYDLPATSGTPSYPHERGRAEARRDYNQHGGKWNLRHCRLHVEATRGRGRGAALRRHGPAIVDSLRVQADHQRRHCFECWARYTNHDDLKPWLVEVTRRRRCPRRRAPTAS